MKTFVLAALLGAGVPSPPDAIPVLHGHTLDWHGLGPIRIGMSWNQVRRLGFALERGKFDKGCTQLPLPNNPQLTLLFESDVLKRITSRDPRIRTAAGIAAGMAESAPPRAYGTKLAIGPQKYVEYGHRMTLISRNGRHAIVFDTEHDRVYQIHAGDADAAQLVEGCL